MKKITLVVISFLITILVLFLTLSSIAGCKRTTPKQLDVYTWGYFPESVAPLFEKETGIKLNIILVTDNEKMLTLLKGGGKADIIMPTHSHLNRFYEANLVQPLDLQIIKNYENVSNSFKDHPWLKWDGMKMGSGEIYAIPYIFGTCGLAINTSKYTKSLDDIGWEVLFDSNLKGRVSSVNYLTSIWLICDLYGIPKENLTTDTEGTLKKINDKAMELKNNVLKFYDMDSEIIDLMKNEEVWVSYIEDGNARKLMQFDPKFKYVLPKEGGRGWADAFMIPKEAANPAEANLLINFMLRPDIAAMLTDISGYTTTVEGALDMTKEIDKDFYRYTEEQLSKLIWPPNISEEVRSVYIEFWEKLTTVQ